MNCSEVQELLSAYYDDELNDRQQSVVAEHLETCSPCASAVAGFARLSETTAGLDPTPPSGQMWRELEKQLDSPPGEQSSTRRATSWLLPLPRLVAVAAAILVVAALGWIATQSLFLHGEHDEFTAQFDHYLEQFQTDPDAAQQFLLAKYPNRRVETGQPIEGLGYRPAIADGLPEGYSVESTHVMTMPCCKCVQCLCKRSDGSALVIFEHDDEETDEWFGDRPERTAKCHGKDCSLVELNGRLAVSWKRDKRYITVVGIRDVAEASELVAWFDEKRRIRLQ